MGNGEAGGGSYVQRVREGTSRYVKDLLEENERLRELAARVGSETLALRERLDRAERLLELERGEHDRLQSRLADAEEESRRFSEQYVAVEAQNSNLANLYVASYRLHSTLDRAEVLAAIQEILVNLVGTEEIAIFEREPSDGSLRLAVSLGVDAERFRRLPAGEGTIGRVAATGELFIVGDGEPAAAGEEELTACVPLKLEGRVTGAIAVFRLLSQKPGLEAIDREIFDLLATHAATALYCTKLHEASP
jgi:nitrate/nitrite-specific signal transduction histidine kinase